MTIRSWLIATLLLAATTGLSQKLQQSHPEAGEVLPRPLKVIRLHFDRMPDVDKLKVKIAGGEATANVVGLHAMSENEVMGFVEGKMPDGAYQVQWSFDNVRLKGSKKKTTISGAIPFRVKRHAGYVEDKWTPPLDIGVLLYDGVEPIDVFGPVEMWMNMGPKWLKVHFIGKTRKEVALTTTSYPAKLAPKMKPEFDFASAPKLDLLMVPGGIGTFEAIDDDATLKYIRDMAKKGAVMTSVCTGSALLAKAGVLKGKKATTNKAFFDYARSQGPANWQKTARWVEDGKVITSSGVTAGIDMSLAVIARFFGQELAEMIADSTEYTWNPDPKADPFTRNLNEAMPFLEQLEE